MHEIDYDFSPAGHAQFETNMTSQMRILIMLFLLFGVSIEATAQMAEKDVHDVIIRLFDGMRAGDSDIVRSVFHDGALIGRAITQGDTTQLRTGPVDSFVEAVGMPHEQTWDERIWNVEISVDGALASAWMEYAFYLGDELHHCGVNSMQLFRSSDGWKIVHLLDTDRGHDCRWRDDDPSRKKN